MARVLLIDTVGGRLTELEQSLAATGWAVTVAREPKEARTTPADAIVLSTDAAGLGQALEDVQAARRDSGTPVVMVTDLDRSGWDRTFGSAEALNVDALFDTPVDPHALVKRLEGILAARTAVRQPDASKMSAIVDQAVADEEAAAAFYRQAAGRVSDPTTREALEGLMRDEQEHKRLIEEFKSGAHPLPDAVSAAGSLVESFGAPEFSADMSPADAFLLAAQKEKLAVELYENWARLYPEGPQRELLLRLADIERGHKARVEAMFSNAAFPESW
jgi:rubrerythrin